MRGSAFSFQNIVNDWTFQSFPSGHSATAVATAFVVGFVRPQLFPFLLVVGVVARASVGPAESLLTMSGNQNVCAAVYAMTLAINIGLNVVLIPTLGLWGAAVATAVAMTFEAAALSFTVWRKLGIVMTIFAVRPRGETG